MSKAADRRRKALLEFLTVHKLSQRALCRAAQLSPAAISAFVNGYSDDLLVRNWEALARGAADLLKRPVSVGELQGEAPRLVAVRSFVGAGDEVYPLEEDGPIDWVPAPPGMANCEATEVRGRSMLPLYHDRDLLFHPRIEGDPSRWRDHVIVAQVRNGKRYVKLLQAGSRRGRFTLVSINPAFAPLEDQQLDWVGPIEWVHKRGR